MRPSRRRPARRAASARRPARAAQNARKSSQREAGLAKREGTDPTPGEYANDLTPRNQPFAINAATKRIRGGGRLVDCGVVVVRGIPRGVAGRERSLDGTPCVLGCGSRERALQVLGRRHRAPAVENAPSRSSAPARPAGSSPSDARPPSSPRVAGTRGRPGSHRGSANRARCRSSRSPDGDHRRSRSRAPSVRGPDRPDAAARS